MLLGLENIERRIGPRTLFRDVNLQVRAGDRIGLVGANGAGKSTLLHIAAGLEPPDGGRVHTARRARVAILRQEIDPAEQRTVREEAALALEHLAELERELRRLEAEMSRVEHEMPEDLTHRYDRTSAAFERGGGYEREARIDAVLAGLGFEESARDRPLSNMSGGWRMRVELAKVLLEDPDVLLLDEPTNHLDLPAIQWFEETLTAFRGGVVVVSHDRTFLRRHVRRVAELDGRGRFTVFEVGYDRYREQSAELREQQMAQKRNQDRLIAQTERFVERFRAKATKAKQAQSRLKALAKMERIDAPEATAKAMRLRIPEPPRSGAVVMTLSGIHKHYGDKRVYEGVDFQLARGDRVALVGPNGAGKSTLLRILAGRLDFDAGERKPGHNVSVAFYAQHQLEVLDPKRSVLEEIAHAATTEDHPRLRGQLGAFLFSGDDVDKKVSVLSGGEKARLALAKLLLRPSNLLILDEPTNHLDIPSCEVLEEGLRSYAGTLVMISHDRAVLNALTQRIVEVRNGELREFLGNYDDYLERIAKASGGAAVEPAPVPARSEAAAARPKPVVHRRDRERQRARDRIGRRIEKLEQKIQERERELSDLSWKLGAPDLHKDLETAQQLELQREEIQAAIDRGYREWEHLADELEAVDSGS